VPDESTMTNLDKIEAMLRYDSVQSWPRFAIGVHILLTDRWPMQLAAKRINARTQEEKHLAGFCGADHFLFAGSPGMTMDRVFNHFANHWLYDVAFENEHWVEFDDDGNIDIVRLEHPRLYRFAGCFMSRDPRYIAKTPIPVEGH